MRVEGPLGNERGWTHLIEQHPCVCQLCLQSIAPGRMLGKGAERRHAKCHNRAQFESMTLDEKEEWLQRIKDLCFGENRLP